MTEQEAISIIKTAIAEIEWEYPMDYVVAFDVAIKAMEKAKDPDRVKVVRCADCKHRPTIEEPYENGFDIDFPDDVCPCQVEDGWYSHMPDDNWFCADGERKETE